MNLLIDKNKFSEVLGNFTGVCNSAYASRVNQILSCVKITVTESGELIARGTDLNTYIEITVPELKLFTPVEFCVRQNKLLSFINTLSDGEVRLTLREDKYSVLIEQLKTKIEIPIMDVAQFPFNFEQVQGTEIEIDTNILKNEIKRAGVCVAKHDSNNILSGINFESAKNKILIASTDGNMLYSSEIELPGDLTEFRTVLPYESVKELVKSVKGNSCRITLGKNNVKICSEGISIVFCTLCGMFPRYLQLIPHHNSSKITLNKEMILNSIRRCQISASEKKDDKDLGSFFVRLNITRDCLKLSSAVLSSAEDNFDIKTDFEIKIALNPKYFSDILNSINTENFVMEFGENNLDGILIKPDSDNSNSLFLIMPIQIKD